MKPGDADVAGFLRDIGYACSFMQSFCDQLLHKYWLSNRDGADELLTLEFDALTDKSLANAITALSLHILTTGKSEKQARVDFLQRILTANGLIVVYLLFNFADEEGKYSEYF